MSEDRENLAARVREAEQHLADLRRRYLDALAEDDRVSRVAFLLYQRDVLASPGWEGPVTWEDWHELTIDSERDAYRERAVELLRILEETDAS